MASSSSTPTSSPLDGIDISSLGDINFADHTSYTKELTSVTIVFLCIVTIFVGLRVGVRFFIVRDHGLDDYLLLLAGLAQAAFCGLMLYGIQLGIGRQIWDTAPLSNILDQAKRIIQALFMLQILYATGISLAKLSIIACYRRVFPNPILFRILMVTGFAIIAMFFCSVFVTVFQCTPVEAAWNFEIKGAKCVNIVDFYYAAGVINALTDLTLCVAPLPLVYRLQIRTREKVIVSCIFGLGFLASAAACMRVAYLHELGGFNVSQTVVHSLEWSLIELSVGIFCPCVPSLRPLFKKLLPSVIQYGSRSAKRSSQHHPANKGFELMSRPDLKNSIAGKKAFGYTAEITADSEDTGPNSSNGRTSRAKSFKDEWMVREFRTSSEEVLADEPTPREEV